MITYKDWVESESSSIFFLDEPHDRIDEIKVDFDSFPLPNRTAKNFVWCSLTSDPKKRAWNRRGERGIDWDKCYLDENDARAELERIREAKKTLKKYKK